MDKLLIGYLTLLNDNNQNETEALLESYEDFSGQCEYKDEDMLIKLYAQAE
ncbi:hypothetical protein [Alkalihalobacillus trypoxylicola]|uniref:hypothetical protein n=1 Tax=Alkalihalobacillus trypoxylicola TaxID=519424 RepID=UPI000AE8B2D1|nr:hypothetical protein [Alkalihalobacillus trypoxylicola]